MSFLLPADTGGCVDCLGNPGKPSPGDDQLVTSPRLPEAFSGFRIVQISDLHNAEFGSGNETLFALLSQASPDILVITGDLIDSRRTDVDVALSVCRWAVELAPVYYIPGNHEARSDQYAQLKAGMEDAGVTVLENEVVMLEQGGESLVLAGVRDPGFQTYYHGGSDAAVVSDVLQHFQLSPDSYTVLLSHRPELFNTYVNAGIDLVFSGHAHGGQFRLPGIGGLFAPNQGFFPQYDAGLYSRGQTNMIVSRGLGNSLFPLRINNPPEIVAVELKKAN